MSGKKAWEIWWRQELGGFGQGGGTQAGMPWEARAWLGLLEAREMRIAVGDTLTSIQQTNGVRIAPCYLAGS